MNLRQRNVDVVTAFEDNAHEMPDVELLDRAVALGRVLFTRDTDFLAEAGRRQENSIFFRGVIFAAQRRVSIGSCVQNLELIAKASEPEDLENTVQFLPL